MCRVYHRATVYLATLASDQTITEWKVHLVQADRTTKSEEPPADVLTLQELPESINFSINKMAVNR